MPRAPRTKSKTGVYHAMIRGINRQHIFQGKEDKVLFLDRLGKIKEHCLFTIYGYCLMTNHVHLLIHENTETISQIMRRLGSSYVYCYNKKHGRVGHLFQGRFRSEPVDMDTYLLTALRYIHQNPVKAGITKNCAGYRWSSYRDYIRPGRTGRCLTDTALCLEIAGGPQQFIEFHQQPSGPVLLDIDDVTRATDEQAKQLIQKALAGKTKADLVKMHHHERNKYLRKLQALPGVSLRQIERITGINRNMIHRA